MFHAETHTYVENRLAYKSLSLLIIVKRLHGENMGTLTTFTVHMWLTTVEPLITNSPNSRNLLYNRLLQWVCMDWHEHVE